MILLIVVGSVLAQDVPVFVDTGESATATVPSYLLPSPMFDLCLANTVAANDILRPSLERCQSTCTTALTEAQEALETCQVTLEMDRDQIVDMGTHVMGLERSVATLKRQRNTAWAVAGGIVAGVAVTTYAVSMR